MRLMSEKGLKHRCRSPIKPETVLVQIKYDEGLNGSIIGGVKWWKQSSPQSP